MSRINETLKQRIDELDLDARLNELSAQAESTVKQLLDSVGGIARDHRDDLDRVLEKVTTTIDSRTDGRYADQVGKATEQVRRGVDKLAHRGEEPPSAG